jgi:SAM-dependent methyltransferase
LAERLANLVPGVEVKGVEVQLRPGCRIEASGFDGASLPYGDHSFDVVLLVDVLHHTEQPDIILREAKRVARRAIVIKDHLREGLLAFHTLSFMDAVGNARHGVALPRNYWTAKEWSEAFDRLDLSIEDWITRLQIYPPPLDWVFGRSLHFLTRLSAPALP